MATIPLRPWAIAFVIAVFAHAALALGDSAPAFPYTVREGFQVEQIYAVPRETQGSWVALTVDGQGRLIASDQKGSLYRIALEKREATAVETIELPIGHAHGLLYAFDSLYAVVAEEVYQGPGLYRIRDTDKDDKFDEVKLLQPLKGTGEHGPHSVVLSPDGNSLVVIAGNKTVVPDKARENSLVPTNWGDDDLLPRLWGPIGSEAGTPAPGGWIASTDPEGKNWQLQVIGLRNGFDVAFNMEGDLFTVDADAEFDLGTPWYQPTRVFHIIPGTDYGWRSGSGKRPPFYPDTLPPVVELGPGSPTGIVSAKGASLPGRYRDCLFVGDWSQGRLLAVHVIPEGSTYQGQVEEILTGTPLPITDLVVHPHDGAIYFTLGGRGVSSGLYRLSWKGEVPNHKPDVSNSGEAFRLRTVRRGLTQQLSGPDVTSAIKDAWPYLAHEDRTIRHAARLVLEHMPQRGWQTQALVEDVPLARLTALLALARSGDKSQLAGIVDSLTEVSWQRLSSSERQLWLRTADVALTRLASIPLEKTLRQQLLGYLEPMFPIGQQDLDGELCRVLVYLQSEKVPSVAMQLIDEAVTQQERLLYAVPLCHQTAGWTPELRQKYFSLLADASDWEGGVSLAKYIEQVAEDALAQVPESDREKYQALLRQSRSVPEAVAPKREFVRKWTVQELMERSEKLEKGDSNTGRRLFATLRCFDCHRFQGEGGGVGPDLTMVVRRFNTRDILEAIIEPDKVISDQFAASLIQTAGGQVITGRVVNLQSDTLLVQTDMLKPSQLKRIPQQEIEAIRQAKTSMMPSGLLDSCSEHEIADLVTFLKGNTIPTVAPEMPPALEGKKAE